MKKWEYDVLIRAKWGYNVDYETKRLAWIILDREKELLKEQLNILYEKESALEKKLEELEEELCKVRRGIRSLEYKEDKIYSYRMHIDPITEKKVG